MKWDLLTRILHWVLATCVVLNLFVIEEGENLHEWIGYGGASVVALRVLWGFVGPPLSRFGSFPVLPQQILGFLRGGMNSKNFEGHNPLASLVYIGIWTAVAGLATTGFMMGLDRFWGEEWLEDTHSNLSIALQVLIVTHLVGVASDSYRYKRKTWKAMLTGTRD